MRKLLTAALILVVAFAALVTYVMLNKPPAKILSRAQVGVFYYLWYDPALEVSWNRTTIIDQPISGYYNSSDPETIRDQLLAIEELGVNFVILSWWGDYYGGFTDRACKQVFEIAQSLNNTLKFAVMVEPFPTALPYDYDGIYNHIYDTYAKPYSDLYYNFSSKPLICFFNNDSLTDNGNFQQDNASRFSVITVGQKDYTQWIYTDLNIYDRPQHDPQGQISVTPRWDDSRYRNLSFPVDPNLTENVYDQNWTKAIQLVRDGKIDIILISSWNEYVERTQIEPCYDGTAKVPTDFLYNKTRDYIKELRIVETPSKPSYQNPLILILVITACTLAAALILRTNNSHKRKKTVSRRSENQ